MELVILTENISLTVQTAIPGGRDTAHQRTHPPNPTGKTRQRKVRVGEDLCQSGLKRGCTLLPLLLQQHFKHYITNVQKN
jgi:hypothetical protein